MSHTNLIHLLIYSQNTLYIIPINSEKYAVTLTFFNQKAINQLKIYLIAH